MNRPADASDGSAQDAAAESAWSCEEIERLYQQALDAVEAVAHDLKSVSQTLSADADGDDSSAGDEDEPTNAVASPVEPELGVASTARTRKRDRNRHRSSKPYYLWAGNR